MYHHLHLLERCAKRMPRSQPLAPANPQGAPTLDPVMIPGAPGWHALNGHIAWFLPQLVGLPQALLLLSGVLRGKPAASLQPRKRAIVSAAICLKGELLPCLLTYHLLQRHERLYQPGDIWLQNLCHRARGQHSATGVQHRSQRVQLRGPSSWEGS